MEKDPCKGVVYLFYVIIPPLFLYFLPFFYPYILLYFKCFFITCGQNGWNRGDQTRGQYYFIIDRS